MYISNLPMGADSDPRAPYNEVERTEEVEVVVRYTIDYEAVVKVPAQTYLGGEVDEGEVHKTAMEIVEEYIHDKELLPDSEIVEGEFLEVV